MKPNAVLDMVESFSQQDASVANLFGQDKGYMDLSQPLKFRESAAYRTNLREFAKFYGEVLNGTRPVHQFKEALTRADLPLYFGDTLQRLMLAKYQIREATWRKYVHVSEVPDFRLVKRNAIDGAEAALTESVDAQSEYPEAQVTESQTTFRVNKFGRIIPVEWEALVNDDLGALREMPARMSRMFTRSETRFVASLMCDSTGPEGTFWTAGNSNVVTSNPILSIPALQTGMEIMDTQEDTENEPIFVDSLHLVIPPALRVRAMNMANMLTVDQSSATAGGTGTAGDGTLRVGNWIMKSFQVHVNEYIPKIATTNGNTSWWLFADPGEGRPAIEVAFMRGRSLPQLLMKASNQTSLDGSPLSPMEGDFETDTTRWKGRHIYGGSRIDFRASVASDGSGS